jgi:hypothetical protein
LRIQKEHYLADQLFLRRHRGQRIDVLDRYHATFDYARLEGKLRVFFREFRKDLREKDRVSLAVSDSCRPREFFADIAERSAFKRQACERVLTTR